MPDAEAHAPLADLIAERARARRPLIVGIAGSVAAGKSTTAQALATLLRDGSDPSTVEVVSTDGFLFSNAELEERHLALRKGFPESYDRSRLIAFLSAVREGRPDIAVPVYDHRTYDLVAGAYQRVGNPDIVLLEGVNALAEPAAEHLDVAVYLDADEGDLRRWFVTRLVSLAAEAAGDPGSFYARWAALPADDLAALAAAAWDHINAVNLAEHIRPTRDRADVVLVKGPDHRVGEVLLRAPRNLSGDP